MDLREILQAVNKSSLDRIAQIEQELIEIKKIERITKIDMRSRKSPLQAELWQLQSNLQRLERGPLH